MKCAFIGLGVMGFPMAGHLANAGVEVCVYNRSPEKAEAWQQQYRGTTAATPKAAAEGADVVFSCVGRDSDVRAVALGEQGIFAGLKQGGIYIDHTTSSAELSRELAAIASAEGCHFADAPVSGGQAGAENAQLTIMVGCAETLYPQIEPLLQTYAKQVRRMGEVGSGQLSKMVNQICVAGLIQGLAEGLHFAEQAGLDAHAVIDVIRQGAAQSWQMENRYETMLAREFEHGFAVEWMRKDLDIVLQAARENGAQLPVTALVDQFYADVEQQGGKRWDTSSLLHRLKPKP